MNKLTLNEPAIKILRNTSNQSLHLQVPLWNLRALWHKSNRRHLRCTGRSTDSCSTVQLGLLFSTTEGIPWHSRIRFITRKLGPKAKDTTFTPIYRLLLVKMCLWQDSWTCLRGRGWVLGWQRTIFPTVLHPLTTKMAENIDTLLKIIAKWVDLLAMIISNNQFVFQFFSSSELTFYDCAVPFRFISGVRASSRGTGEIPPVKRLFQVESRS